MRIVKLSLILPTEFSSGLRFITSQSPEKVADGSYLCKYTENRRRARKLEKGKCPDFQKEAKDELYNLGW